MRRGAGFAGRSVARTSKTGGRLQSGCARDEFALALGWRRIDGFEIAEKQHYAYPSHVMEGLAHGSARPRDFALTLTPKTRELSNRQQFKKRIYGSLSSISRPKKG
jgi:hypothetical protein